METPVKKILWNQFCPLEFRRGYNVPSSHGTMSSSNMAQSSNMIPCTTYRARADDSISIGEGPRAVWIASIEIFTQEATQAVHWRSHQFRVACTRYSLSYDTRTEICMYVYNHNICIPYICFTTPHVNTLHII